MKNIKLIFVLLIMALGVIRCKNKEEKNAEATLDKYKMYIDSVNKLEEKDAMANLEAIDVENIEIKTDAEISIEMLENNEQYAKRLIDYSIQYDKFRNNIVSEKTNLAVSKTSKIRLSVLGNEAVGNDMKFNWVNKYNILSIYDNFISTVEKNKDTYSREDWDEIKLLYEALDTRKNTVEKEGLSNEDNRKIAGLKLKFATIYTLNRVDSKSKENSEAKK